MKMDECLKPIICWKVIIAPEKHLSVCVPTWSSELHQIVDIAKKELQRTYDLIACLASLKRATEDPVLS